MATTIDAKTAARQRVRAFLNARQNYAASLGHSGFVPDEITRQIPNAQVTMFAAHDLQAPIDPAQIPRLSEVFPLLASDLAILTADD